MPENCRDVGATPSWRLAPVSGTSAPTEDSARRLLRVVLRPVFAVAAGLLVCASFPPIGLWPAAIVGLAVFGWIIAADETSWRSGAFHGLLFGLAFYLPLLPWTGAFVGTLPWLTLSFLCALFPMMFGAAAALTRHLPGWPAWWTTIWLLVEWLKSIFPFGGFPWGLIGFGQADGPLAAYARIGGVTLVSVVTVLAGFTLALVSVAATKRRPDRAPTRRTAAVAVGTLVVIAVGSSVLWFAIGRASSRDAPTITVAAIQGNVPRLGLDFNAQRRAVLTNHVSQTNALADDVTAGLAPQPRLIVWPENSSDIDPFADPEAAAQITSAARRIGAPILVGAVLQARDASLASGATTNTVIAWDPELGPGARHDKKILQPFGEYMPWRSFFRQFSADVDRAGYFVPGNGTGVVDVAGTSVGITTCWEVIFDRSARAAVNNGAQILAVPSNNATFTESMSRQQLAFGKIRAIEHGRTVVVAATTGISAIIGPDGSTIGQTGFFERGYLVATVRLDSGLTPASQWAPTIQALVVAAGFGALIGAAPYARLRRRHGKEA